MKYTFKYTPVGQSNIVSLVLCPGDRNAALAGPKVSHSGQIDIIEPIHGASAVTTPRGVGLSTENIRACKEFPTNYLAEQYARVTLAALRGARGTLIKETGGGRMNLINAVCVAADPEVIGILTITRFVFTGSLWTN